MEKRIFVFRLFCSNGLEAKTGNLVSGQRQNVLQVWVSLGAVRSCPEDALFRDVERFTNVLGNDRRGRSRQANNSFGFDLLDETGNCSKVSVSIGHGHGKRPEC